MLARLYALDPATVKLVKLPLNKIMIDEGDFTRTTTGTSYFDVVYDIKPGLNFKNQTFYDGMDHKKYSSYGFGAGYNPWTIENKSTITFSWKPSGRGEYECDNRIQLSAAWKSVREKNGTGIRP